MLINFTESRDFLRTIHWMPWHARIVIDFENTKTVTKRIHSFSSIIHSVGLGVNEQIFTINEVCFKIVVNKALRGGP